MYRGESNQRGVASIGDDFEGDSGVLFSLAHFY